MNTDLKIFNFGPAALNSADSFRHAAKLLQNFKGQSILILASALDGVSVLLEKIVDAHQKSEDEKALEILQEVRKIYYDLAKELLGENHPVFDDLNDHLVTIEWDLEDPPQEDINFAYDQVVSIGSLMSSQILSAYLNESALATQWLDARDIILADDEFRNGNIQLDETKSRAQSSIQPLLKQGSFVLTQAALGTTTENYSIILNSSEGSAYSVAILGDCLNAKELYSWTKALTADVNSFDNVIQLENH